MKKGIIERMYAFSKVVYRDGYILEVFADIKGRENEYDMLLIKFNYKKQFENIQVVTYENNESTVNSSVTNSLTDIDIDIILDFIKKEGLLQMLYQHINRAYVSC